MANGMMTGDMLWQIWFAVGLLAAGIFFLAKLKFGSRFYVRQEKRWLHCYTSRKLEPLDAEGRSRSVKVRDVDAEEAAKNKAGVSALPVPAPAPTVPPKKPGRAAK